MVLITLTHGTGSVGSSVSISPQLGAQGQVCLEKWISCRDTQEREVGGHNLRGSRQERPLPPCPGTQVPTQWFCSEGLDW